MGNRLALHKKLVEIMGDNKVYFQPPESIQLNYPCVIYKLMGKSTLYADNIKYKNMDRYEAILIDKDPDSVYSEEIFKLRYCSLDRTYINDNLHHFAFTIFN